MTENNLTPNNEQTPPAPENVENVQNQQPGADTLTLTQSELDKMINKAVSTSTANWTKKLEEAQKRIKGLEAQNMTAEELAQQQQKELEQANAAKIAELTENNQRLQIKAKIAETGFPLDESLFVNPSLDIESIFKNIDNMAKKYQDDLEKAIASKQSRAGASIALRTGTESQVPASNQEYAKKVPWV